MIDSPLKGESVGTSTSSAVIQAPAWKVTFRLLICIWACFLVRGIFYSSVLPLWEGYDEFSHFAYVQQLVYPGNIPIVNQTAASREIEESLRLLPHPWTSERLAPPVVTHDVYWKLPSQDRETRQQRLCSMPRDSARQASGDPSLLYESLQPPLYYWLASGVLRLIARATLPSRVIAVRWFSVSIASLVVPLGFLLARRVLRHDGLALGVVALVTAMPELMIDVSRVANDTLAIPLYTLLVLLALRWLENPVDLKRSFDLGLTLALGLLTKAYFLTAIPILVFMPVPALWRGRNRFRVFLNGSAAGVTPILLAGWWYLRNHRSTGTWFWQPGAELIRGIPLTSVLGRAPEVNWRNVLLSVQISHIWFGGWSFLQVRGWMYRFFWDIFLLACVGLAVCAWRLLQSKDAHVLLRGADLLVLLGFYSLFCLGLAYHALLMYILQHVSATDGWYLYCPVVVEIILASAGLLALLPKRYRRWILPTGTFCFALLDLYATHCLLIPYYTGMIAHRANGGLATFHLGLLKDLPVSLVIQRLLVNKPSLLSGPVLAVIWIFFLVSTLSLIVLGGTKGRRSRAA
jgi:hypothetical protein